jgi:hypothetical protein
MIYMEVPPMPDTQFKATLEMIIASAEDIDLLIG